MKCALSYVLICCTTEPPQCFGWQRCFFTTTNGYLAVAFVSRSYFLIQMHTTAAWPSSAQQVGSICIILLLHGFNFHILAPLFYTAIPNMVHFTPMTYAAGLCTYSNPLFHFALCVVSGSLSQRLCYCCLLTMHLEVCASS